MLYTYISPNTINNTLRQKLFSALYRRGKRTGEKFIKFPKITFQRKELTSISSLCFLLNSILILYLVKSRVAVMETLSKAQPQPSLLALSLWHLPCSLYPWHGLCWLPWDQAGEKALWNALWSPTYLLNE